MSSPNISLTSFMDDDYVECIDDVERLRFSSTAMELESAHFEPINSTFTEQFNFNDNSMIREIVLNVSDINITNNKNDEEGETNIEISLNSSYTEKTEDTKRISVMLAALRDSEDKSDDISEALENMEQNATEQRQCVQSEIEKNRQPLKEVTTKLCLQIPPKFIGDKDLNEFNLPKTVPATSPLFAMVCDDVHTPDSFENFVPTSKFEGPLNKFLY